MSGALGAVFSQLDHDRLVKVCRKVRKWAERYATKHDFTSDLNGLCAITSAELWKQLKEAGIESIICINKQDSHVYIEANGMIVDVTATQFGKPKVVVEDRGPRTSKYYWDKGRYFRSARTLRKHQVATGWPESQIAKRE